MNTETKNEVKRISGRSDINCKDISISNQVREEGNKLFQSKNHDPEIHLKILRLYNKSAALAPYGSEELAMAFRNRSVLLFHLNKFSRCIIDIDYSLPITKLKKNQIKLLIRKVAALVSLRKKNDAQKVYDEVINMIKSLDKKKAELAKKFKEELNSYMNKELEPQDDNIKVDKLDIPSAENLPFLSDAITLELDPKYGRQFLANRDIKTGEILIIEESFNKEIYCTFPDEEELYSSCSHCLKLAFNGIPCENCIFAIYCSKKCKDEAKKIYHDLECSISSELLQCIEKEILKGELSLIRMFLSLLQSGQIHEYLKKFKKIEKEEEKSKELKLPVDVQNKSQTFEFFCFLSKYHIKDDKSDKLEQLKVLLIKLIERCKFFSGKPFSSFFDESLCQRLIVYLMKTLLINGYHTMRQYYIVDEEKIGWSIYPLSSFLTHSCYSNTGKFFVDGPRIIVYASRPIKKNEQLLHSYGPLYTSKNKIERQSKLQQKYQFDCTCEACENNWPIINKEFTNSYFDKISSKGYKGKLVDLKKKISSNFNGQGVFTFGPDKESFANLCRLIDLSHSFLSSFEAGIVVNHWDLDYSLNCVLKQLYDVKLGEFFRHDKCS